MNDVKISLSKICKSYDGRQKVLHDVSLEAESGIVWGITGQNGAGKSTLIKIIAGLLRPSSGILRLDAGGQKIPESGYFRHCSLVAPYLVLYEEFTPLEHLSAIAALRGQAPDNELNQENLEKLKLFRHRNRQIKEFSSGMKQRMKYALALQNRSEVLLLDEPASNLDAEGTGPVHQIIREHSESGGIVIIATNDKADKELCSGITSLGRTSI